MSHERQRHLKILRCWYKLINVEVGIHMRYRLFFISSFVLYTGAAHAADDVFRVMLEEPVAGEIHGGVGNLRGWAVATES